MRLLIVLITYNRLAYTKRTLRSLWDATSDEANYFLVVVDNNSTDGTQDYLKRLLKRRRINEVIFNPANYYPGKACNIGWERGMKLYVPDFLMRLDNDMEFEKNWDLKVEEYFKAIPELGQLGIEHEAIEEPGAELRKRYINGKVINEWPGCVGGPMVMKKKLWDKGIRYDESPWKADNPQIPSMQEDAKLSHDIQRLGYITAHAQEELGRTFANSANWSDFPQYYKETMPLRGYGDLVDGL